jgi:hypothetical protein
VAQQWAAGSAIGVDPLWGLLLLRRQRAARARLGGRREGGFRSGLGQGLGSGLRRWLRRGIVLLWSALGHGLRRGVRYRRRRRLRQRLGARRPYRRGPWRRFGGRRRREIGDGRGRRDAGGFVPVGRRCLGRGDLGRGDLGRCHLHRGRLGDRSFSGRGYFFLRGRSFLWRRRRLDDHDLDRRALLCLCAFQSTANAYLETRPH